MAFLVPLAIAGASAAGATAAGSSLATLGAVASVAAGGIGAFGAIRQGQAQQASQDYNAKIASNNAQIATQNAAFAGAEGDTNAAAKEMQTRAKVGAITAAQGANGLDVNKGSAVDVRASAAELGQLDAMTIRSNAARQAYGYQTQAVSDNAQSALDRATGKNDATAGYITAGGTLLSTIGSTALNFAKFQGSNSFTTDDLNAPNAASAAAGGANNEED